MFLARWAFVEPVEWPFVVIAFMRSIMGFRCPAPMNRGTTNGLGEGLRYGNPKRKRGNGLRPCASLAHASGYDAHLPAKNAACNFKGRK